MAARGRAAARQLGRAWRMECSPTAPFFRSPRPFPPSSFLFTSAAPRQPHSRLSAEHPVPPNPPGSSTSLNSAASQARRFSSSLLPAIFGFVGVLGVVGLFDSALADAGEEGGGGNQAPAASVLPSSFDAMEKLVRQERRRLEELLRSKEMQRGTYPSFTVSVKGQKQVTVKFQIPPTTDVSHLIVDLISQLGLKSERHGGGSEMLVRAWDSPVAWQLTLNPIEDDGTGRGSDRSEDKDRHTENLCILIFESLVSSENCEIEFIKPGTFSSMELDAIVSALKLAGSRADVKKPLGQKPGSHTFRRERQNNSQVEKTVASLEAMGVRVYGLDEPRGTPSDGAISWDIIAGYEQQKREIEDTILLALQNPEVYDEIARQTRRIFETNRPRAVLFEGPPGTGKTSCARVIANQAGVPLLYVPLEIVMSKYYGESERLLGTVFSLSNELPDGAIIFLDEVDSFAAARDSEMHEATRRILSVLLRQIDGFEQEKKVVIIAATNRKEDLDPALISRFDSMIPFSLPDQRNREEIAAQYAKHLKKSELVQFAAVTAEMSGRDIRDVCQQAERHWASKLIRGRATNDAEEVLLPPLEEYIRCAEVRRKALLDVSEKRNRNSASNSNRDRGPLAFV